MKKLITLAAAVAVAATLAGCASAPEPVAHVAAQHVVHRGMEPGPATLPAVTFAAVGDSITATDQPTGPGSFENSWTSYAGGNDVTYLNSDYTHSGYTSDQLAAGSHAAGADVIVIAIGTNDIGPARRFFPVSTSLADVVTIAERAGAEHVIVDAIPPMNRNPIEAGQWNDDLKVLAAQRGWTFLDPWASARSSANTYLPGAGEPDGIHPMPATAAIAGSIVHAAILEVAGR